MSLATLGAAKKLDELRSREAATTEHYLDGLDRSKWTATAFSVRPSPTAGAVLQGRSLRGTVSFAHAAEMRPDIFFSLQLQWHPTPPIYTQGRQDKTLTSIGGRSLGGKPLAEDAIIGTGESAQGAHGRIANGEKGGEMR